MTTDTTSNFIFCGLVSGYQGENNTVTPNEAATAVEKELAAIGMYPLTQDGCVSPGVCVYHAEWGCPVGGEPVGAFTLDSSDALDIAEKLRVAMKQSTLSVCLPSTGTPTIGFFALGKGMLKEWGTKWQEIAAEKFKETGIYVSCGICRNKCGMLTFSAEANPEFVKDLDAWKKVAQSICISLGLEAEFSNVCFNYLR